MPIPELLEWACFFCTVVRSVMSEKTFTFATDLVTQACAVPA